MTIQIDYNCGNQHISEAIVSTSSVRIDSKLIDLAREAAQAEFRTVQGQLEYWARVGRTALANPDLPIDFIAESIVSLAEPRHLATEFSPKE